MNNCQPVKKLDTNDQSNGRVLDPEQIYLIDLSRDSRTTWYGPRIYKSYYVDFIRCLSSP